MTAYTPDQAGLPSPDCGHTWTRPGRFTITVTTYFIIDWKTPLAQGQEIADFTQKSDVVIGEVEAVNALPR
jgi:hypothetical protein